MIAIPAARAGITGHGEITRQALRTGRRALAIWAAAFAALVTIYAVIWPSIRETPTGGTSSTRSRRPIVPCLPRAAPST